ncbi:putative F-box protein PP2-B12 [Lathyrus oleraceus]|uniref:putative F-box protein PP2-B12 n=1 Tax=Pisum sativum TaxID=3888 RepID=UPI0021CFD507|nr:putative F-box protein PP2-B12 [Pisum sativum]
MAEFEVLTEGCIASILSHTKPIDACRLSLVSKTFRSAANSDTVWNKFLQSDTPFINYVFSHSPTLANFPTKKALYMFLCDHPIIIDHGEKSFHLERKNGRKCFMLAPKSLYIEWTTIPDSRFPEILKFCHVCMHKIHELVFKKTDEWLVKHEPVKFLVSVQSGHSLGVNPFEEWQHHSVRRDGWLETKLGIDYNFGIENEQVHIRVLEIRGCNWTSSLSLQGIEIRPYQF